MLVLLALLLVIGAVVAVSASRASARRKAEEAAALEGVRRAAEEDVLRLGEDITSLDVDLAGRELDEGTRQDYRRALDAYDSAKVALDQMRRAEEVRGVTQALEDGRYAMSCVRARLDGRPLPARRPPCFFNPQHGPSVEDVQWAPPGGIPRSVPACAADAERVRLGAEPDARKVLVGGSRRPYWEAGPAYGPWAQGYFAPYAMSGLLPGILMGAVLTGGFGGWDGGHDGGGYDDGSGGGDGGMDDAGDGGGEGFGDFGGGDFGGFE
jgi:hypothetical protein